jgi:hypothetical protein
MQCCGEKRGSQKRRWRGGLVAWVKCWLKMSMQCCGEKRGLHIVVRKGCERGELLVESCGCFPRDLRCCDRVLRKVKCCDRRCLCVGLQWVGLQFVGGFAGEFGVVVFVEYVGVGKVSVCSWGTNHGDHGCGGCGKLWKVKWRSSEVGMRRNGGGGDLEAVMVS